MEDLEALGREIAETLIEDAKEYGKGVGEEAAEFIKEIGKDVAKMTFEAKTAQDDTAKADAQENLDNYLAAVESRCATVGLDAQEHFISKIKVVAKTLLKFALPMI